MYIVLLLFVLMIVFVVIRKKKNKNYDYKCFLLTLKSEHARRQRFMSSHDKDIPIEVIYGPDTRAVKTAAEFEDVIEPEYFEKALEMHYNPNVKRPDMTYFNMGAIGCFMGHMEFYDRCFKQGLKYAVMFEDNVIIKSSELYDEIQSVIDEKGDDFEMCFFHCISRLSGKNDGKLENVKWISSTKCYLINVDNMKKYIKYFIPMDNHVDMKHEDLIAKGARVYYKDLRSCIKIDRTHVSTISHREHGNESFFSRQYPNITTKSLKHGF